MRSLSLVRSPLTLCAVVAVLFVSLYVREMIRLERRVQASALAECRSDRRVCEVDGQYYDFRGGR